MKKLERIYYYTMNSWNGEQSLAYNMKIYNVIRPELQDRAFEIYNDEDLGHVLYNEINVLIDEFTAATNYEYTAGFNGRSGGYLVLYKSELTTDTRLDGTKYSKLQVHTHGMCEKDVPGNVKRAFAKLARDIVKTAEAYCRKPIETTKITTEHEIRVFGETMGK